jgi:hypothetical protein
MYIPDFFREERPEILWEGANRYITPSWYPASQSMARSCQLEITRSCTPTGPFDSLRTAI